MVGIWSEGANPYVCWLQVPVGVGAGLGYRWSVQNLVVCVRWVAYPRQAVPGSSSSDLGA